ncbi:MAG TPA: polyamine ABC transporter substrate-binding protein [Steroidobacteraceae bacterium]|jgi:putrescine transport system substrate-binding protein
MRRCTGVLLLALALGGCGSRHAPAAVSTEKVVNLYNWGDYVDPSVLTDFEKEYGIHVTYDVYDSDEILETKLLAGHSRYDVVVPSAYFLEHEIKAGVYRKLDKSKLPNLKNMDAEVTRGLAAYDPGNQYAVGYMWLSTTGIGYNVAAIRARMPKAPVDSWRMFFDPAVLAHFQDCGIAMLDAPINVVGAALAYLGKDPNSQSPEDLAAVEGLLYAVRPYVRTINSAQYYGDLANADLCLVLGWSGDIILSRERAREAGKSVELAFSIPREGTVSNFDVLAIPQGATHPDNAHLFINYLLRPEVAARNTNALMYANSVMTASLPMLEERVRNDPGIYPPPEVRAKLVPSRAKSPAYTRLLMHTWTRFKSHSPPAGAPASGGS